jgi:hypothetical protein
MPASWESGSQTDHSQGLRVSRACPGSVRVLLLPQHTFFTADFHRANFLLFSGPFDDLTWWAEDDANKNSNK